MNEEIQKCGDIIYKRISKKKAVNVFTKGMSVFLLPSKVRFNNMWIKPYEINKNHGYNFDQIISTYIYCNCNNEYGRYPKFYVNLTNLQN